MNWGVVIECKKTRKDKEQRYGIRANKDPSEIYFAIFRDALSHMGEDTVYRAAAEAQSRFNNDLGRGVDALVTGHRTKSISAICQFPPLY